MAPPSRVMVARAMDYTGYRDWIIMVVQLVGGNARDLVKAITVIAALLVTVRAFARTQTSSRR